ncbi:MAG TPA: hypothetical protein VFH31_06670 [Pyrinomonadaceae bacterium]|nr:hypothetical protein [Pyrinomonadaceae bacterium]
MRTRLTLTTIMIGMLTALAAVAAITVLTKPSPALAQGATQISGIAFFAEPGECTDPEGQGADFALRMTGDLQGCHYVFVETAVCSPSGTYRETGAEIFVGHYNEGFGTFSTSYLFTAKYEDCSALIGEIFGRCQHPLIVNSGTGVFEDFTGRIDFKDDVEEGNFPYRGHLQR